MLHKVNNKTYKKISKLCLKYKFLLFFAFVIKKLEYTTTQNLTIQTLKKFKGSKLDKNECLFYLFLQAIFLIFVKY